MTRPYARVLLSATIASLLWPAITLARIDAKNANYSWGTQIVIGPRDGTAFGLSYQSRTTYRGLFGFGWCSDLETRLEIELDGSFRMIECGAGSETLFELKVEGQLRERQFGRPAPELAEIIARRGSDKVYRKLDGESVALDNVVKVRELLAKNVTAKELLKEVGQKPPTLGPGDYVAKADGSRATFDGNRVRIALSDGRRLVFDRHGELLRATDANGSLEIVSREDRKWVIDIRGVRAVLELGTENRAGLVERLRAGDRVVADFTYVLSSRITTLGAIGSSTYSASFKYDDLVNMTTRLERGRDVERITYDQNRDWALSTVDVASGCVDKNDYFVESSNDAERVKQAEFNLHWLSRVRSLSTDNGKKPGEVGYTLLRRRCQGIEKVVGAEAFGYIKADTGDQRLVASTSWFDTAGASLAEYASSGRLQAIVQPPLAVPSMIDTESPTVQLTNALFSVRYREPSECMQDLTAEGVIMLRDPLQPLPFRARAKRIPMLGECAITSLEWQTHDGTLRMAIERGRDGSSDAIVLNDEERWQTTLSPTTPPLGCSLKAASREIEPAQVVARVNAALRAPCAPTHRAAQQVALVFSMIQSAYTCSCAVASASEHRVADFARWIVRGAYLSGRPAKR